MATDNFGSKLTSANLKAGRISSYPPVSLSSFGFPDVALADPAPETVFADEKPISLDLGDTLADMNRWADHRVAIFASLDAALSRAVVEAASALSELKQQTENEARLTTMTIVSERERLQRQVEDLRLERVRLQDQLTEVRREIEAEQTHKLAVEREAQSVLDNAKRDRDRVQVEVNQLSQQMDAMGQQLQTFFQQRFAELWEQFSASVSQKPTEEEVAAPSVEQVFGNNFDPAALWANNAPPIMLEPAFETPVQPEPVPDPGPSEIKVAVTLQQFEDAPTPKANVQPLAPSPSLATVSVLANVQPVAPTSSGSETVPKSEKVVFNESEIELDESDFVKIFQTSTPAEKGNIAADAGSPATLVKTANGQGKARQTQARQRIERLMSKRSNRVARIGSGPTKTDTHRRRALRDRQAFDELGAKLGLGTAAATPPPFDDIDFAEGFTPPPEVSNFLLRMTTGPESRAVSSAANRPSNSTSDPTDAGTIRLEDIFTQIPADLPLEVATNAADMVDWDELSPSIGELGPDFAQHWYDDVLVGAISPVVEEPPPQVEVEPIQPVRDSDPLLPPIGPSRSYTPLSDSIFGNWPTVSVMPPPLKIASEAEQKSGIISKVYVSNLQGLALLTIEKVLRGLPGVYQVIVTTLEKGEIGMEVRHHTELELDKVLPNLPDFRLKLVEHNQNVLKFIQMR